MLAHAGESSHIDKPQRTAEPGDEEHAEQESGVADAVDDERFVGGVAGRFGMEKKSNDEVGAEANAFPANEHEHIVVGEDEGEHGEHEEVEVPEEAVVAAFMRHVADGINMDEHADAGNE